ncbi:hypothetical protein FZEAL_8571 [Fusarium zealandicum]|uniref:F-box domain-containing protein n=1 Tax=Fusarium zealandicum TaxID=1053134 RepID=A0A8H4UDZ1_9HYPO|nr:hypothetical protein FZEAL_8571 [Fusarium zealandicum]
MRFSLFTLAFATAALAAPLSKRAVFSSTTYDDLSISGGTAGNAQQEALDKLGGLPADLATVEEADVDFLNSVNQVANDVEKEAFNTAIEAASGEEADALQRGKIKNKVLKLTATMLKLQVQQAQGEDVAAQLEEENTKLQNNISQDEEAAGQASTFLAFDATVGMSANNDADANYHGAFYRLPTEILTMIVRDCIDEEAEKRARHCFRDSYSTLKALRVTHPRFADLSYINTILFSSIQLEPTLAGLASIQRSDVSRVAGYATAVTFITPPGWALSFETFHDIVTVSTLRELSKQFFKNPFDPYFPTHCFQKSRQDKFVNEYLAGQWPLTETQLRDGYAAYMRDAEATRTLLEESDGQLKTAWTGLLKKLGSRLCKIRLVNHSCDDIRQVDYYDSPSKPEAEPPCRLGSHHHSTTAEADGCEFANAKAGDRIFAMVMSCLATSGVAVRWLTIRNIMTCNFAQGSISGLDQMNLGSLEKLKFSSCILVDGDLSTANIDFTPLQSATEEKIERRVSEGLHALLEKSSGSLQYLKVEGHGAVTWPCHPASFDMPALEHLDCAFVNINPQLMNNWMAHMPRLRHMSLGCCHLSKEQDYREWRHILDAIRDHPSVAGPDAKGLMVNLEQIITSQWGETSYGGIVRRPDNVATGAERSEVFDELEDTDWALNRHFHGEVPFLSNHTLRHSLDDWEPDDEDDEDIDDEDGDSSSEDEEDDEEGEEDDSEPYNSDNSGVDDDEEDTIH